MLNGGLGYKDYYDMVENSAKKISNNDKQKDYSASDTRKKCETKQKEILASLIGKEFTKEDIKLAKKDNDTIKQQIRTTLSNAGNKNPELRFLDCTSGKLLKYLIRIELRNYNNCLKKNKKLKTEKTENKCNLNIVTKADNKYMLNTQYLLPLIIKIKTSFKSLKEKLDQKLSKNPPETKMSSQELIDDLKTATGAELKTDNVTDKAIADMKQIVGNIQTNTTDIQNGGASSSSSGTEDLFLFGCILLVIGIFVTGATLGAAFPVILIGLLLMSTSVAIEIASKKNKKHRGGGVLNNKKIIPIYEIKQEIEILEQLPEHVQNKIFLEFLFS